MTGRVILVVGLVALIFVAHVFLWLSEMDFGLKVTFTLLNVLGWTIVLLPILLIDRWLDAINARNRDD